MLQAVAVNGMRIAGGSSVATKKQMPWLIPTLPARSARWSIFAMAAVWFVSLLAGCASRDRARVAAVDPLGKTQFENYCAACHQSDGQGVTAEAPPLAGASWVAGPQDRLIRILLHGVRGPIEVSGKTYNREMPGFGQILSDEEIATLASFVRGRFGGPGTPIEPVAVSRIRAATRQRTGAWTADELLEDR